MKVTSILCMAGALGWCSWQYQQHRHDRDALVVLQQKVASLQESATVHADTAEAFASYVALARLRSAAVPVAAASPSAEAASPPAPAPSSMASLPPQHRPLEARDTVDRLEAALNAQTKDASWADTAQKQVREKLTALLPGAAALRTIDCRASLCRVDLSFENQEQYRQFQQRNFQSGPFWPGAGMSTMLEGPPDGEVTVVTYLAKEGQALPLPGARTL